VNQIAHHHAMTNILQLTICPLFSSRKFQLSCIIYDHAKNMKVPMVAMERTQNMQRSRGGDYQLKILYTQGLGVDCFIWYHPVLVWYDWWTYQPVVRLGTFSNFHTSLVLILVTFYNFHTNLVVVLGPKLWYEAGISLVFKLVTGARLVVPQVPTRLVLVSGWYCLKSFWSARVLGTSIDTIADIKQTPEY
jgi:hypothetical protein